MADHISPSQKGIKTERKRDRAVSSVWNRMLLISGLALLVPFGACAPRAMYNTDNIIKVLFKQNSEKNSILHLGESSAKDGYEVTLTDILLPYDDVPLNAVLQISHDVDGEQSLIQTGFREGQTKQIRMLDGTILQISVNNIRIAPNRSDSSVRFIARKFKSEE